MDLENLLPSCSICNAHPVNCPHDYQTRTLAESQAVQQWSGLQRIKDWVRNHARNRVTQNFRRMRTARYAHLQATLHTIPRYELYRRFNGRPPLPATEIAALRAHVENEQRAYRLGVNQDWARCCQRYPEELRHFFGLVTWKLPDNAT